MTDQNLRRYYVFNYSAYFLSLIRYIGYLTLILAAFFIVSSFPVNAQEIAHFTYNENVNDSLRNFNVTYFNGTSFNATPVLAASNFIGRLGNAFQKTTSASENITVSRLSLPSNFTIVFWLNISSFGSRGILSQLDTIARNGVIRGYSVERASDNALLFQLDNTSLAGGVTLFSNYKHPEEIYIQYAVRFNSTHATIFVNGTLDSTISGTNLYLPALSTNLTIGYSDRTPVSLPTGSQIDDLRIYNSSLSTAQINTIYNEGYGTELPLANITTVINVTIFDISNNASIQHFSVNGTVLKTGQTRNMSNTNNGTVMFQALRNATWQLKIWNNSNYSVSTVNITTRINSNSENLTLFVTRQGSIYLTIFDEETNSLIKQNVTVEVVGATNTNSSTQNGTLLISGLTSGSYEIRYEAPFYTHRNYFLNIQENIGSDSAKLYLLNSSISNFVVFNLVDEKNNKLSNVILKVLRRYGNSFETVLMSKSDFGGQAIADLILNVQEYRFMIDDGNITIYDSSSEVKIASLTPTIRVILGTANLKFVEGLESVFASNVTYTPSTKTFTFAYSDTSGFVTNACLEVRRITVNLTNPVISNTCSTSSASVLTYTLATTNGTFHATGYFNLTSGGALVVDTDQETLTTNTAIFGGFGIFMAFLMFIGTIAVATYSAPLAIIVGLLGLGLPMVFGFYTMPVQVLVGLILAGFVIILAPNRGEK